MSRPFTIRPAIAADLPAILELVKEGLGAPATRKRTAAFWRWKHEQQPFGESIVFVAESAGGQLVGLRAFMRWRFRGRAEGRESHWSAVRAVDTVTHRAHRRRGIFSALNRSALAAAREEGVDFVFNTPNAQSAPGYLKQGWLDGGSLPFYLRPVRVLDLARAGFRYLQRVDREAARQWRPAGLEAMTAADATSLAASPQRPTDHSKGLLETCDFPSFYRWRYCRHPHLKYYKVPMGAPPGLLVVRPNVRLGAQELVVCEVPRTAPGQAAVSTAARLLRESGASYCVAHSHRRHPNRQVLGSCGFRRAPFAGLRLLVRPLSERARRRPLTRVTDWGFETGDLEVF